MGQSKHTKKALLASVLSIVACCALLIGSTFAWFTDEVTSGNNRIVAGNLDVELYHGDNQKVEDATELFKVDAWEPGVMAYENFTVKNEGSLALAYQLSLNIKDFNTVAGTEKSLKDVLKVAVMDGAFSGDRGDVPTESFVSLADFSRTGTLNENGDSQTYGVIIWWEPSAIDDDYNLNNGKVSSDGQPLSIDLGVNLEATQTPHEQDSFDENYDENAPYLSIKVTPENAQSVLDGEQGSLDNRIIVFTAGEYGELEIGRPTKYEGSNTIVTSTTPHRYYTRTLNNVIFTAEEGASLSRIVISSGHVNGEGYDYVRDEPFSGHGYFLTHKIRHIVFKDITFTDQAYIVTSQGDTVIDDVTFDNCTFTGKGTSRDDGQALRFYNEINNGNMRNLTVKNCTFRNWYQAIYTQHIAGIRVEGCKFDTLGHNAIAVQNQTETNHKQVVILNNTFANITDRIIRFHLVGVDTQITIKGNTASACGDSDGEIMRATALASGIVYDIRGNDWGEGHVPQTQLQDQTP